MNIGYLDTNILVAYFGGDAAVKTAFEKFAGLKLPVVSYIEFMTGLETHREEELFDGIIQNLFEIVHTDMNICKEAAELRRTTRLKLPDALIYATARARGGTLITRDKDFDGKAGDVYVPY